MAYINICGTEPHSYPYNTLAISQIGIKPYTETVLFLGWFGPRGFTFVVVLLLMVMEKLGVN